MNLQINMVALKTALNTLTWIQLQRLYSNVFELRLIPIHKHLPTIRSRYRAEAGHYALSLLALTNKAPALPKDTEGELDWHNHASVDKLTDSVGNMDFRFEQRIDKLPFKQNLHESGNAFDHVLAQLPLSRIRACIRNVYFLRSRFRIQSGDIVGLSTATIKRLRKQK